MEGFYFLSLSKISFDLTSLINVFITDWWTKKRDFEVKQQAMEDLNIQLELAGNEIHTRERPILQA